MSNMMSYRDPVTPDKKVSPSTHRRHSSYDADDEDHLDFDPNDFVLPDGTYVLDPEAMQRIEDATKMLRELEVNKEIGGMVGASPSGESAASGKSDKENEEPEPVLKSDDIDYDGDDDDMVFGRTSTPKGKRKETMQLTAENNGDENMEMIMEDDEQTDDTLIIGRKPRQSGSATKRNQKERATSLEEANTQIWLLSSIIKDQQREIKELKAIVASQAAKAKQRDETAYLNNVLSNKKPLFMGDTPDDRDSPFYSRPARDGHGETIADKKPGRKTSRQVKVPDIFQKIQDDQRKRKAEWADEDEQHLNRNTVRAKKAKRKGRSFDLEKTNMGPVDDDLFKSRDDMMTDLLLNRLDSEDLKAISGGRKVRAPRASGGLFLATESKDRDLGSDVDATGPNSKYNPNQRSSKKKHDGMGSGKIDESEAKGDTGRRGVTDAEEEFDVNTWLPTGDPVKDRLALNKISAEVERLKLKKEERQRREKEREELKAMKQKDTKVEVEEMEE